MIDRRDLLRTAAAGMALTAASPVSACSYAEYEEDAWGEKLVAFFRTGDVSRLDGLFRDFTTLVTFDDTFGGTPKMLFKGSAEVQDALHSSRNSMTRKLWTGPKILVDAKIIGSRQQGRMNRIELLFAEKQTVDTSCGPDRAELRTDLYYQAGVYETGDDWVKWAIERLAFMPPLELERFNV